MVEFLEKYRIHIGIILIVIILSGCGILLWQNQIGGFSSSSEDQELANLQRQNQELRSQIAELETQTKSSPSAESASPAGGSTGEKAESGQVKSGQSVSAKININTADAQTLDILPGIGPSRAQAIIEYRQTHGGFKSISEIQNIKGIGPKTFEKMQDMITVE